MREAHSFCRICGVLCGTRLTVDDNERLVEVRGDKQHANSRGYACVKGVQSADIYDGPERLRRPLKRMADGSFQEIGLAQALDEIAGKLSALIAAGGAASSAVFRGTPNNMDAAGYHMMPAWMATIGSPSFFSTITIDQSAKAVTVERLGMWAGGRQEFHDADVWMMVGINPLVSNWGGFNAVPSNPALMLRDAKARGMKLIVIDPRRTETANFADIYLQIRPGEDPTLAAGLLNIILTEGWHDADFCVDHVEGLDVLKVAVRPFTPDYVAARAGVAADELRAAAEMFARNGIRGVVLTGTGPDMAARSNLAEHLYESINVVCGRFLRAGEEVRNQRVLAGRPPMRAEVIAPGRSFEKGHRSRIRGVGTLRGEMMSGIMADEILTPGEGRISSLIVVAGNPAGAFPDQLKTVEALSALDLLVTIDPYMSETARLAHYVLPPPMPYERPDMALAFPMPFSGPFAQYTPAIVPHPPGSELVEEWRLLWELARRLGLPLTYDGVALDMTEAPTADDLLTILARRSMVPLDEVKRHPSGHIFDLPPLIVESARADVVGRFQVAPDDICADIAAVAAEPIETMPDFSHRLVSRRMREVMNTTFRHLPSTQKRYSFNPAFMHSDDLTAHGFAAGDRIEITSDRGSIPAIVAVDDNVRPGVVSMTHGWGGLPGEDGDYADGGSATTRLISIDRDVERENAMARMSSIPVNLARA